MLESEFVEGVSCAFVFAKRDVVDEDVVKDAGKKDDVIDVKMEDGEKKVGEIKEDAE